MRGSNHKVIYMLWIVIVVLIIGGGIIGFMLVHKTEELNEANAELNNSVSSLRGQLNELRQPSPSPSPSTAAPARTASPTPTSSPSHTPTPSPSSNL